MIFEIDRNTQEVKLDVAWIKLYPEFRDLFDSRTSRKSSYDSDTLGRKRLTYIYFMVDYSSPLHDLPEEKRKKESLRVAELTEDDIDTQKMKDAIIKYEWLLVERCRPLRTYKAAMKGLDSMDSYLEEVNFTKVDKQGKLLYTPNQFTDNIRRVEDAYTALDKLKKRVEEAFKQNTGIRGSATLGDREMKQDNINVGVWDEGGDPLETKQQKTFVELSEGLIKRNNSSSSE